MKARSQSKHKFSTPASPVSEAGAQKKSRQPVTATASLMSGEDRTLRNRPFLSHHAPPVRLSLVRNPRNWNRLQQSLTNSPWPRFPAAGDTRVHQLCTNRAPA